STKLAKFSGNTECIFPMVPVKVEDKIQCLFPCPYFTYNIQEYEFMYYCHVIPGIIAFLSCLAVLIDTILVLHENGKLRFLTDRKRHICPKLWKNEATNILESKDSDSSKSRSKTKTGGTS